MEAQRNRSRLAIACAAAALAACQGSSVAESNEERAAMPAAPEAARDSPSIAAAIAASPDHRILAGLLQTTGLAAALDGPHAYTVFAPTDAAFAAAPGAARWAGTDGKEAGVAALSRHVVPGIFGADALTRAVGAAPDGRARLRTVTGDSLAVGREGGALVVTAGRRSARIGASLAPVSNGAVHSVDSLLAG